MTTPNLPSASIKEAFMHDAGEPLKTVAWIADRSLRYLNERTRKSVAVFPYQFNSDEHALVRLSDHEASIRAKDAEIAEWRKLLDPAVLHANLVRGVPAKLTREQLLHLLGDDAEIAALKAELRDREAHLFEARKLLNERPAINAGLFEAYSKWTGKVYSLDWLNAIDSIKGDANAD
jgi:hypothetical protein